MNHLIRVREYKEKNKNIGFIKFRKDFYLWVVHPFQYNLFGRGFLL